jgi:hypothetical protein
MEREALKRALGHSPSKKEMKAAKIAKKMLETDARSTTKTVFNMQLVSYGRNDETKEGTYERVTGPIAAKEILIEHDRGDVISKLDSVRTKARKAFSGMHAIHMCAFCARRLPSEAASRRASNMLLCCPGAYGRERRAWLASSPWR